MSALSDRLRGLLSGWGAALRLGRADRCDYRALLNATEAGRALLAGAERDHIAFVEHDRQPAQPLLACQPAGGDGMALFVVHIGRLREADLPLLVDRIVHARQLRALGLTGQEPAWTPADAIPAGRLLAAGRLAAQFEIAVQMQRAGRAEPLRALMRREATAPLVETVLAVGDVNHARLKGVLAAFSRSDALKAEADRATLAMLRHHAQAPGGIDEFMLRPFTQGTAHRVLRGDDAGINLPDDISPLHPDWHQIRDEAIARDVRHASWAFAEAVQRHHLRQPGRPAGGPKP